MKPRQIITRPHRSDCDIREWVNPVSVWLNRDRIGRPRRSVMNEFLFFCCNNEECPAQMIMPWHEAENALGINSREEVKE